MTENLLQKVLEFVEEVPFGNSDFQNRMAIVNDEQTPERAYRHAALRIVNRVQALQEAQYSLRKKQIEIRILERDREKEQDELKRQLIDLDIEQHNNTLPYIKKLVNDAIKEVESLWPVIESVGRLTRREFERGELEHFSKKLGKALSTEDDLYARIEKSCPDRLGSQSEFIGLLSDFSKK